MAHCDQIVATIKAEHLDGENGYRLLLAEVSSSTGRHKMMHKMMHRLNDASSYASFCVYLLNEHYSARIFHKKMKMALFSISYNNDGYVYSALETQREIYYKDALKGLLCTRWFLAWSRLIILVGSMKRETVKQ